MRFLIKQEKLHSALSTIVRICATRTTLPILSSVLIEAKENQLVFTATNLEQAITVSHTGKTEQEGRASCPARVLTELISTLPKTETITVSLEENKLQISSKTTNATINTTNIDEFPELPQIKGSDSFILPAQTLKKALAKTLFSVSKDDSRQILTGVLFNFTQEKLLLVSTDSYRLSEIEVQKNQERDNFVVPTEALSDLIKILEDEDVEIKTEETQIKITYKETQIITRLIEGSFPDYRQLIPKKEDQEIFINKQELLAALKTISVFAKESAGGVKILADEHNQTLEISSIATQIGENITTIPAGIKGGGEQTINSRYLIDALNAIEGQEEVEMFFNDKLSPLVITTQNKHHTQLIMPLKS